MSAIRILFCHVLLFGIAISSPIEGKDKDQKLVSEVTTRMPMKAVTSKSINNEQVQSLNNAQVGKSSTKKRNVPRVPTEKNENFDDDFYEGRANEDYDGNQAFRTLLDNSKNANSLLDLGKYRGMVLNPLRKGSKVGVEITRRRKTNDYRYYEDDARRKRTASLESMLGRADGNQEPEIGLSPEDLMTLAAYRQQYRLYNNYPYGSWNDVNNALDVPEEETETEEVYDRPESFFDRYYDRRYQNWANLPRSNKFMNHQERGFAGFPKMQTPVYKRAIF